jgi:hypothetical protein
VTRAQYAIKRLAWRNAKAAVTLECSLLRPGYNSESAKRAEAVLRETCAAIAPKPDCYTALVNCRWMLLSLRIRESIADRARLERLEREYWKELRIKYSASDIHQIVADQYAEPISESGVAA